MKTEQKVTLKLAKVVNSFQVLNFFINGRTENLPPTEDAPQGRQVQIPAPKVPGIPFQIRYWLGKNRDELERVAKNWEKGHKQLMEIHGEPVIVRGNKVEEFFNTFFGKEHPITKRYFLLTMRSGISQTTFEEIKENASFEKTKLDNWFKKNPPGTRNEVVHQKNIIAFSDDLRVLEETEETINIAIFSFSDIPKEVGENPDFGTLASQLTFMWGEEDNTETKPGQEEKPEPEKPIKRGK